MNVIALLGALLICTRFDNEEVGQLPVSNYADIADKCGLEHVFIPVKSGVYDELSIEQFGIATSSAKGKVHGYCRTGTRAAHLWALSRSDSSRATQQIAACGVNVDAIESI